MPKVGRWNEHVFEVSSALVRGFTDFNMTGSCETEETTTDGQKYVTRKAGNPAETSFTVLLNAYLGCEVREEALAFIEDANAGVQDYFYVGSKKLFPCQMMLTEANVQETVISANGQWISCAVALTMQQCTKNDGGTSSNNGSSGSGSATESASSSNKASVKTTDYIGMGAGASGNGLLTHTSGTGTDDTSSGSLFSHAISYLQTTTAEAKAASSSKIVKVNLLKLLK